MNDEAPTDAQVRHRAPLPAIVKRLWFRNTVAVFVAVGAFAGSNYLDVLRGPLYAEYFASRFPSHAIARGQTDSVGGQDWSLIEVKDISRVPLARKPLPKGTQVTVVRIGRTGIPSASDLCFAYLVDGDRRWKAESSYTGYWVKPPDDGTTEYCYKPGPLQFSFLVPADAKPQWVEILNGDGSLKTRLDL